MDYVGIIIPFVGGLGMFIYGMQIMAQGLENAAGSRMKTLLEALTRNKLMGVLLGALITAVIQSSSATTVMVVGFVNAGIMNLSQTMGVIMGANIGTTVTGWLVSSVEVLKSGQSGTDRDHGRCDRDADRKETFNKRCFQHYHRIRSFVCRNYNDVICGSAASGVGDVPQPVRDIGTQSVPRNPCGRRRDGDHPEFIGVGRNPAESCGSGTGSV